jgi:hypothetical protein
MKSESTDAHFQLAELAGWSYDSLVFLREEMLARIATISAQVEDAHYVESIGAGEYDRDWMCRATTALEVNSAVRSEWSHKSSTT